MAVPDDGNAEARGARRGSLLALLADLRAFRRHPSSAAEGRALLSRANAVPGLSAEVVRGQQEASASGSGGTGQQVSTRPVRTTFMMGASMISPSDPDRTTERKDTSRAGLMGILGAIGIVITALVFLLPILLA